MEHDKKRKREEDDPKHEGHHEHDTHHSGEHKHHHHHDHHGHHHEHKHDEHHEHKHDEHHEHEHKAKKHASGEGEVVQTGSVESGATEKALTWQHVIKKTTVGDLCRRKAVQRPLITLKETDTLRDAMNTLATNSILSAPILDSHSNFLGFVDVLDIVGYIFITYGKKSDRFDDPHFVKDEFFQTEIRKVQNFSKVDSTVKVSEEASIAELINLFKEPWRYHRLHRVAVIDKNAKLINVISHSDIVALAVANIETIPESKRTTTLDELGVINKPIFARIDDPFTDALDALYSNRVSGIALIDNEAHVSANFSASDLRGMSDDAFRWFNGTTLSFLVKGTDAKLGPPIQRLDTTTFAAALATMYENKVHRIYIVTDLGEHISGVVSISDLVPLLGDM